MFTDGSDRNLTHIADELKSSGAPFVVATVVRTVSVTAAKPGAKAILSADGTMISGWIGGGCARHAVSVAAKKALDDGQPRLVQLQPEDLLNENGLVAGSDADGVLVARNMCPSQGTMDIFVEPVLSNPELLVLGLSPIAQSLAALGNSCGFSVATSAHNCTTEAADTLSYRQLSDIPDAHTHRYIVIATQGTSDLDTIKTALQLQARHLAFVGSRKKISHLQQKLRSDGYSESDQKKLTGPAGLDIGGVTPQEIALSIIAEIIQIRRSKRMAERMANHKQAPNL